MLVQQYALGPKHEVMGSALHIPLPSAPAVGSKVKVTIRYKTTDGCTAIQWLEKEYVHFPPTPHSAVAQANLI